MDKSSGQKSASSPLYPMTSPFDQRMMDMGDGHRLYVEQCGNPNGQPVIILHGGPGGGCSPLMRRFFNPDHYRVILFDQRGCGRSRPFASVDNNTTWHLVADIERIRSKLEINDWIVFGGSWGATLGLIYAQTHPSAVQALILRGVFLMTQTELDWFYGGGVAKFWPDLWNRFVDPIPEDERDDLIYAYHKRLFCGKRDVELAHAQVWSAWENALASMESNGHWAAGNSDHSHAFARLENHYFMNRGFLDHDGQILTNMDRIAHIPGLIVQGRYDMICPPQAAYDLSNRWPAARLHMVKNAGHALSEPAITAALVAEMDRIAGL